MQYIPQIYPNYSLSLFIFDQEKQAAKEMENVVDEDGWITVTKHGRNKGVPRTEAQEQKVSRKEKRKRKQKVDVIFKHSEFNFL